MWKSTALAIIFAVPAISNTDCGGCDPSGGNGGTDDTSIDDTGTDDTGDTDPVPCTGFSGLASPAEFDATPRAEPLMELLAIALHPGFTADEVLYTRLASDVHAIRQDPETSLENITYFAPHDGRTLVVGGDLTTLQAMANGTYTDWDCANDWYEMVDVQLHTTSVTIEFEGTYDLLDLADEYSNFPGVTWAEPDSIIGDGPTICVTIDGDTHHYVFDDASNDCQSGCIDHAYYYYTTDSTGNLSEAKSWSTTGPASIPKPAWVDQYGC